MYAVLRFVDDNSVAVVPTNWLLKNKKMCLWPTVLGTHELTKAVKRRAHLNPSTTPSFKVKVIKTTATYDEARQKLPQAENSDNVDTTDQEKGRGKRRKYTRILSSSDDSEEEDNLNLPEPPFSQSTSSASNDGRTTSRQRLTETASEKTQQADLSVQTAHLSSVEEQRESENDSLSESQAPGSQQAQCAVQSFQSAHQPRAPFLQPRRESPLQWSISSAQGGWRRAPAAQSRSDSPLCMAPSSQGSLPGIPFPELHLDSPRWIAQHSQESCLGVQVPAAQTYPGTGHSEFATQSCHLELPRWPASSSQGKLYYLSHLGT
ncbi:uncharacterized protein [Dermacentor albipictus]|uniref:uncharacterized protein n=1 Tax=Dermacentor albipictus TaxID=60249 RepID=UPI0038FD05B1